MKEHNLEVSQAAPLGSTTITSMADMPNEVHEPQSKIHHLDTTNKAQEKPASKVDRHQSQSSLLGENDQIGSGDSHIHYNALPSVPSPSLFTTLKSEINWQSMSHKSGSVPRLVAVQGSISPEDGSIPVYRHPTDEYLPLLSFSPTVLAIKADVERTTGHPMNHVLIQLYRSGHDHISEHSDKTLDIARNTNIVNVSLGAQRTMRLRTKKSASASASTHVCPSTHSPSNTPAKPPIPRTTQLVPLPHGSIFILGPQSNTTFLHGINPDKRPLSQRLPAENAFEGERISLTFRLIATFLSADRRFIWGQGARGKSKEEKREVLNGDEKETERLVRMFGVENQSTVFSWEETYGEGSDLLDFWKAPVVE